MVEDSGALTVHEYSWITQSTSSAFTMKLLTNHGATIPLENLIHYDEHSAVMSQLDGDKHEQRAELYCQELPQGFEVWVRSSPRL